MDRTVSYSSGTLDTVSGIPSGGTFTEAQTFAVGAAPTRTNFRFMGWSDGINTYQPGATYTVAQSNVNLTAQWRQSSLAGTSNSDIARVLTWNIVGSETIDATVSSDSGSSSVRVVIPANSFDAGTEIIFWRLTNQNLSKTTINNSYDYLVNFAVSWSIGDDISTAKRVITARSPIQITVKNSSIQKGASAWMIIGGVATALGSATQDGEINVSITEDPIITLANVSTSGNNNSNSLEAARLAREKAKADARAEILRLIREGKPITVKLLNAADIDGATDKNISPINSEILRLSDKDKESISSVEKILYRYMTANRIAKGFQVSFFDLQNLVGQVKTDSFYKSAFNVGLRNANSDQLDTIEKIQTLVFEIEKRVSDRKADILARIAGIKARLLR